MKIAVFFPGIGYHCDKPLLYYARKLVQEYGYEKIVMQEYSYNGKNIRGDKKKMQEAFESLYAQAEKKLEEIAFDEYSEVLFISKSVGTIIASAYAEKYKIKCCQILYTPVEQTFMFEHDDAIAFIGTADPWSDRSEEHTLNSSHRCISYAVFCLKKKKNNKYTLTTVNDRATTLQLSHYYNHIPTT